MAAAAILPSKPVGALACQKDSYLQSLDVEVLSCHKVPAAQEKERGKAKAQNAPSKDLWQVEFTDSVLFPEGGGQHSDHGTLLALNSGSDDGKSIPITNVQRDGLRSICYTPLNLEPGTKVRQTVDFQRRREHMQNHTGQHLLSAIMDTYPNLETLGWGMGTAGSANYVDLPRTPSAEEIREIQGRCNEAIRENYAIDVVYPEGDGIGQANGEDKNEKGVIRIIKIGDLDSNPCCGTHLRQTSHIRLILLQNTQQIRGGKNTRLYFLTGDLALENASSCSAGIRRMAYDLSCGTGADDVVAKVKKIQLDAADSRRRETKLLKEIAKFEGERIKASLCAGRNAFLHRPGEGGEFIQMVAFEIKQAIKEAKGCVVVFATGEEKKAGQVVVLGSSGEVVETFTKRLAESGVEVKGNGKGERWQGKVAEWKKGDVKKIEGLVTASSS